MSTTTGDNLQAATDAAKAMLDADAANITTLQAAVTAARSVIDSDTQTINDLEAQVADLSAQLATYPKPALAGLGVRDGLPPVGYGSSFPVVHVSINWRDIEKSPGVYDFSPIDAALDSIRQVGVRIFAGQYSPAFYLDADGPRVHIVDNFSGLAADVPRWWVVGGVLHTAYAALHKAIAAKYDNDPRLREMSASLCTTIFAEPCMRQIGNSATRANLLAAGYTRDLDLVALHAMIDVHKVYRRTPTGIAHNPFQYVKADGTGGTDVAATLALMDYERQALGELAVLQNNSLDDPASNVATENTMYSGIAARGGRISFQTVAASRMSSAAQVANMCAYAVSLGASSLEFSPGGWTAYLPPAQAASVNSKLAANAA